MKLLSLIMINFQGLKLGKFIFNGNNASLYGDNATYKTTVFNSLTWLLFDKASTGAKNFTPKTKGPEGDLHFLDHSSEGSFEVDGGRVVTLKKVFHENYKKRRGATAEEFDGHSVDYFIDGVPVKEKEYIETVEEFCGDSERMKMLTIPSYFPESLPWEQRRQILLEICGDINDSDVIASDVELVDLKGYLLQPGTKNQCYTVDEYKKIAASKKTEIKNQLEEIPGRIDENNRALPDTKNLNIDNIESEIKELNKKKEEIESEIQDAKSSNNALAAVRKQIADATAQLSEARAEHITKNNKINEDTQKEINDTKKKINDARSRFSDNKYGIDNLTRDNNRIIKLRAELLKEYESIQAEQWYKGTDLCPTCHQALPAEQLQKLHEDFNLRKSQRLEANNARGKAEASQSMIQANEAKIKELTEWNENETLLIAELEKQLTALEDKIQIPENFEETSLYIQISKQINKFKTDALNKDKNSENLIAGLREKLNTVNTGIREQEQLIAQIKSSESIKQRIRELSKQEKELAQSYEFIERGIFLCELFIKTKVGLLDDRINSKFKCVRFRLFVEQLNGGLKEDCEVLVPAEGGSMIPFAFANNGARINAGLEIIDTLSKHWKLSIPLFVDNAESVTHLLNMDTQLIRLIVSEPDKVLRTVIEGREKEVVTTGKIKTRGKK